MYGRGQLCKLNDSSINNEIHERQRRKDPPLRRRKLVVPCASSCAYQGVWGMQCWRMVRGAEGSFGVSFQPKPFRGSADGIFLVESLQWKFCIPEQVHLRWSPSRRALLESSKQQVDLGCISTCPARNCEYGAGEILITTHSFSLALPFLTLQFAAWKAGHREIQAYLQSHRFGLFHAAFILLLNPWLLCARATSHMLEMLKSKYFADCTSMQSQRGSEQ